MGPSPQVKIFKIIWFAVVFWDSLAYLLYFQIKPQSFIAMDFSAWAVAGI